MFSRDVAAGVHRIEDAFTNWYIVEADDGLTIVGSGLWESAFGGRYRLLILNRLTAGVASRLPAASRALTRNACLPGLSLL
jgi:hypothetical protein